LPSVPVAAVDVAFTPADLPAAEVAVVVDVLRATSTIAQAIASGYQRVHCCETLDEARALGGPGRVLAGERQCVKPADFAHGNSPMDLARGRPLGQELVLATTNGTPAIAAAVRSGPRLVLLGSLLNLDAVLRAIPPDSSVAVVCSGTDGRPALEDVYVAGKIVGRLRGERSDAAQIALACAQAWPAPIDPLSASADATRLRATGQERDIAWCSCESVLDVVPVATGVSAGVVAARLALPEGDLAAARGDDDASPPRRALSGRQ
jgi:2-phosphosulfolactate phosphatase